MGPKEGRVAETNQNESPFPWAKWSFHLLILVNLVVNRVTDLAPQVTESELRVKAPWLWTEQQR